jgi:hypothetical protein
VAELTAGPVIDRMRQVAGVKTDTALGAYFGLGTSAVSNWRQRGTIPYDECVILSIRKGASLDWLILGIETSGRTTAGHRVHDAGLGDERMQRLHQFLDHWDATRGADDKVWLEMQVARAVPEYAEWVAARAKPA